MQVAVLGQVRGSAAPRFNLSDIFKATKVPEIKKYLVTDSEVWKEERSMAEIALISLRTTMRALSYSKSTDTCGIKKLVMAIRVTVVRF